MHRLNVEDDKILCHRYIKDTTLDTYNQLNHESNIEGGSIGFLFIKSFKESGWFIATVQMTSIFWSILFFLINHNITVTDNERNSCCTFLSRKVDRSISSFPYFSACYLFHMGERSYNYLMQNKLTIYCWFFTILCNVDIANYC